MGEKAALGFGPDHIRTLVSMAIWQINSIFFGDLEIRFKLFFLIGSCSADLAIQESD